MKTFIATLLATAVSASFAAAPTAALNHDPATYHNLTQKATADYKAATAKCVSMTGNAKTVCTEEAKAARAHAEADAIAQYNNTPMGRAKARTAVADADFTLAKAKCGDMSGADKDACIANATSVHTAAVAGAKADHVAGAASPAAATRDAAKSAAVDKCAQLAGQPKTGCLVDGRTADTGTATAPGAPATVADKTREMAATTVEKTRNAAAVVAGKTERATEKMEDRSAIAARKSGAMVADSVITTKVKADIFKEPELKSMAIHVETEHGVVMLSGFVDSKADADKAVQVAKSVDGVASVKSAIKVK